MFPPCLKLSLINCVKVISMFNEALMQRILRADVTVSLIKIGNMVDENEFMAIRYNVSKVSDMQSQGYTFP